MKFIKSKDIDKYHDDAIIYVNRNALNAAIAKYEVDPFDSHQDKLDTLLDVWKKVYQTEKETQRVMLFIEMPVKDVKKCFKDYSLYPNGSFGIPMKRASK